MKKRPILFAVFLLFCFNLLSQNAYITSSLQKRLKASKQKEAIPVLIILKEQLNFQELKTSFHNKKLPADERAEEVIRLLHEQYESEQLKFVEGLNQYIDKNPGSIEIAKRYWIYNMLLVEATRDAIDDLSFNKNIEYLEYADQKITLIEPTEVKPNVSKNTPGAPEPGLIAINAPSMWALGYTGRGRMVYNYDTGVWPNHPAFASRFLANFYPVDQCWYGYYSQEPTGEYHSHGTHTLGTMIGLDTATNDTIGAAYKSYWIANDLVRSTVGELPPISDMVLAFEWALDPDGNPSTTSDIPDVINNSWRWYDGADTTYCGGFVEGMLNTLEVAGMAVIFAGGNHGPGNTTVSSPQRTKTSLVNSFCVGALDGNDPQYPIANFSTRGPSQCTGNIPLNIHPEVSAPGVSVRSAYGQQGYSELSGTSMACPHVSGAVLLLKEAFPFLTGEEILFALYNTAIDLGDPGEDNTFGNGIIDVYEAYLYLSQTYTPVSPDYDHDIAITTVDVENCVNSISPSVEVSNLGNIEIDSFSAYFEVNGDSIQQIEYTDILASGESVFINFDEIDLDSNQSELAFHILPNDSLSEVDFINNHRRTVVSFYMESDPFIEDFEDEIAILCWPQEIISGINLWEVGSGVPGSLPHSAYSGELNAYFYCSQNQTTKLLLPKMDLTSLSNPALRFWHAQASIFDLHDVLNIYYKTSNTGQWTLLQEYSEPIEEWTEQTILLPNPSQEYYIAFEGNSFAGKGICIDDVQITNQSGVERKKIQMEEVFTIKPNPSSGFLYIDCKMGNIGKTDITICDLSGSMIYNKLTDINNTHGIDISNLQEGIYSITFRNNPVLETKKLFIIK
jgi:bacillopeptidase F